MKLTTVQLKRQLDIAKIELEHAHTRQDHDSMLRLGTLVAVLKDTLIEELESQNMRLIISSTQPFGLKLAN